MIFRLCMFSMLSLCATFFMSGCGTTGGTSVIDYTPNPPVSTDKIPVLHLSSLTLQNDGTKLVNVGTPAWGEFNRDGSDLLILKKSLERTIGNINNLTTDKSIHLNINIIINRYLVAHSNNAGAAIASISWCITNNNDDKILFKEKFFAASTGYAITSIGAIKNNTNRNIIKRIVEKSLNFDSANPPTPTENTSNNLDDVVKLLPTSMMSLDSNMMLQGHRLKQSTYAKSDIIWEWVDPPNEINWGSCIKN